jgi:hypothetical protein
MSGAAKREMTTIGSVSIEWAIVNFNLNRVYIYTYSWAPSLCKPVFNSELLNMKVKKKKENKVFEATYKNVVP